jgi:hypothetical protein
MCFSEIGEAVSACVDWFDGLRTPADWFAFTVDVSVVLLDWARP